MTVPKSVFQNVLMMIVALTVTQKKRALLKLARTSLKKFAKFAKFAMLEKETRFSCVDVVN